MTTRLDRLGPLAGVLSAVLGIAGFGTARPGPGSSAQGAAIIAYFTKHASSQKLADTLLMLSGAFFVVFAASLRQRLADKTFSGAALAGAAVLAAGVGVYFGCDYVLTIAPSHLTPSAAQALNMLALDLFFPVSAGCLAFGIGAGVAIMRSSQLPKWLGAIVIVIGVVGATPVTLAALFALFVWTAVTALILWSRSRNSDAADDDTTRVLTKAAF